MIKNKYDRVILGKYGTGVCTVDVYRVLDAFKTDSPAVDHAVKKLLCPGGRGHKDRITDLKEAIQSIHAEIDLNEIRQEHLANTAADIPDTEQRVPDDCGYSCE